MPRDREYLFDILEAARTIQAYTDGMDKNHFLADIKCQDAVIRRFEIIGEATRRLTNETRENISDLPWKEMIAMRNHLAHRYDDIDVTIVWDTIEKDIPVLIAGLEKFVS